MNPVIVQMLNQAEKRRRSEHVEAFSASPRTPDLSRQAQDSGELGALQGEKTVYHRILIALEGKETDQVLLDHVQRLATQTGAQLTLLRVIGIADDGGGGLGKQFQLEVGSSGWRRKNEAEAYLSRCEYQLRRAGLSIETALVIGTRSEGDEIVAYAVGNGHDLIAMASDPRPWYRRWIGGSPANAVLRKATVPTLIVADGLAEGPAAQPAPPLNPIMAALGRADL